MNPTFEKVSINRHMWQEYPELLSENLSCWLRYSNKADVCASTYHVDTRCTGPQIMYCETCFWESGDGVLLILPVNLCVVILPNLKRVKSMVYKQLRKRKVLRFILTVSSCGPMILFSGPAAAYLGPGAGLGMIGSLIAVIVVVLVIVLGLVIYPIRVMRKRKSLAESSNSSTKMEE